MNAVDSLARLAQVIEARKPANGGDPEKSYVARLLYKGPDAFLKKIETDKKAKAKEYREKAKERRKGKAVTIKI